MVPVAAGSSPVIHPKSSSAPDSGSSPSGVLLNQRQADLPWMLIVWNDPINLMTYVSYVFRSYFGYSEAEAERLMLLVHHEGRAVVATGSREEIERHTEAMHEYGLQASMTRADA